MPGIAVRLHDTLHGHKVQAAYRNLQTPAGTEYGGMHSYGTAPMRSHKLTYQQNMSLQVIATKTGPASWPLEGPPRMGEAGERGRGPQL